jgi:hypothetical protein
MFTLRVWPVRRRLRIHFIVSPFTPERFQGRFMASFAVIPGRFMVAAQRADDKAIAADHAPAREIVAALDMADHTHLGTS